MLKLWDGTRKRDKLQLFTRTYIKKINKLIGSHSGAPLVLGQATSNSRLTRLTTARTQGKPPPSPIQYSLRLFATPTSEWHFVPKLPRRSPKTIPVWTLKTLRVHNSLFRPPIFDIYTSIAFQLYKERLKARCFDPCNRTLKFRESRRTSKSPFREVSVIFTLFQKWGYDSFAL